LIERLRQESKLTADQYEGVLHHIQRTGSTPEEALIETAILPEAELLKYLAKIYNTRFVSTDRLSKADIDPATLGTIPRKIAEQFQVFPVLFDSTNRVLSVVTPDAGNLELTKQVQVSSNAREVRVFVARPAAVKAAISKFYGGDIHAFSHIDRQQIEQYKNMLNVFERNLVSDLEAHALPTDPFNGGLGIVPGGDRLLLPSRWSPESATRVEQDEVFVVDISDPTAPAFADQPAFVVEDDPEPIVVDPVTGLAFVVNLTSHGITVIDTAPDPMVLVDASPDASLTPTGFSDRQVGDFAEPLGGSTAEISLATIGCPPACGTRNTSSRCQRWPAAQRNSAPSARNRCSGGTRRRRRR
jgi:hypothetical protein